MENPRENGEIPSGGFLRQIIKIVQEYPVLYDRTHQLAFNKRACEKAWDDIGKRLGRVGHNCSSTYNSLYQQFGIEHVMRTHPEMVAEGYQHKEFQYYNEMLFYKDYIHLGRPTKRVKKMMKHFENQKKLEADIVQEPKNSKKAEKKERFRQKKLRRKAKVLEKRCREEFSGPSGKFYKYSNTGQPNLWASQIAPPEEEIEQFDSFPLSANQPQQCVAPMAPMQTSTPVRKNPKAQKPVIVHTKPIPTRLTGAMKPLQHPRPSGSSRDNFRNPPAFSNTQIELQKISPPMDLYGNVVQQESPRPQMNPNRNSEPAPVPKPMEPPQLSPYGNGSPATQQPPHLSSYGQPGSPIGAQHQSFSNYPDIDLQEVDFFFKSVSQQVKRANLSPVNFRDLQLAIFSAINIKFQ